METVLMVPARIRRAAWLHERFAASDHVCLSPTDSAVCALTDFQEDYPITVEADCSIHDALADMHRLAVHALLVTRQDPGGDDQDVIGLITYYDIERRYPHRYPGAVAGGELMVSQEFNAVRVGEVMVGCDDLALVKYGSLLRLTARELYEMFQGTGLTHLLVVEHHENDSVLARGLVSRAALAKRLDHSR